jgi:serine/threonine protein kinase
MTTDADRWACIEELCQAALDRQADQQAAFLESVCGSDQDLRREIESLLAHRRQAEGFIEAPAIEVAAQALAAEDTRGAANASHLVGRVISHYRIVEKIASGGMGDVYRAVRSDGSYDKEVAIKVIQGARSTDFFLARFQTERQILATLDHPNVARLLDGGTTEEGLPYVVMEFIRGLPIDEFCAEKRLDVDERLTLFRTVCSAVQYAHQNLVVHRDLKPSNILVTAEGVPKLLDFGIAKILHPQHGEGALPETVTLLRLLTPDYASPEQVRNEPISTSSDVYSLGVILYKLLTGHVPYLVAIDSPREMMQAICEIEPERPSTAVTRAPALQDSIQERDGQSGAIPSPKREKQKELRKILEGDLDNIVLKALRKEPQRRYSSVDQFSEDIRRYLAGLPVLAHRDTVRYRTSKFISRHKFGVAAAALFAVAALVGLSAILYEARIARANELRAEKRFNDVRQLANSLMFEINDSIRELPGATATRKLIIQRAQEYLDRLAHESSNDPALLRELAAAYAKLAEVEGSVQNANLGETPRALQNYRKAAALLENASSLEPLNRELRRELGQRYLDLALAQGLTGGEKTEYKNMLNRALGILEPLALVNPEDAKTQDALAVAYDSKAQYLRYDNDFPGSLDYDGRALAIFEHLAKAESANELYLTQISNAHRNMGAVLSIQKQWLAALEHYRVALPIDEAQVSLHPDSVSARWDLSVNYSNTGFILVRQGDADSALKYYFKVLKIRESLVAADPKDTRALTGLGNTCLYISTIYERQEKFPPAVAYKKKAAAIRETIAQKDPTNKVDREAVAWAQGALGQLYANMATKAHSVPHKELAFCRASVAWLQPALPVLLQRKAEGRLWGTDGEELERYLHSFDNCRQTVARLAEASSRR